MEQLNKEREGTKENKKRKTVITYGTFDLFHQGHYKLLERAKALGDYLIVGVTTEMYDQARGKLNVVDDILTRIENVKKSGFADEIIIEETAEQKVRDVKKYNVDVFTVGSDWVGAFDYMKEYCEVVYLERTRGVSSTMLRNQRYKIQQIGMIGTGRIASRFLAEANSVSGVSVQGVYNPNMESAGRFARKNGLQCYATLEDVYGEVDIIYVASPHETHYAYVKDALLHGKHVLCEKPMVLEKAQAEELYRLADEKDLILMEAVKTAYCPGFQRLLQVAESGVIGKVRYIDACFTKLESKERRELIDHSFGGSFTELASYCLLPIVKLLGTDHEEITYESLYNDKHLDVFTKASVTYLDGLATATCGLGVKSEGRLLIAGEMGYIVAQAPWWKTTHFEVHFEDTTKTKVYEERFLGDGLRYEISECLKRINNTNRKDAKLSSSESIAMAAMIEGFLKKEERE